MSLLFFHRNRVALNCLNFNGNIELVSYISSYQITTPVNCNLFLHLALKHVANVTIHSWSIQLHPTKVLFPGLLIYYLSLQIRNLRCVSKRLLFLFTLTHCSCSYKVCTVPYSVYALGSYYFLIMWHFELWPFCPFLPERHADEHTRTCDQVQQNILILLANTTFLSGCWDIPVRYEEEEETFYYVVCYFIILQESFGNRFSWLRN